MEQVGYEKLHFITNFHKMFEYRLRRIQNEIGYIGTLNY